MFEKKRGRPNSLYAKRIQKSSSFDFTLERFFIFLCLILFAVSWLYFSRDSSNTQIFQAQLERKLPGAEEPHRDQQSKSQSREPEEVSLESLIGDGLREQAILDTAKRQHELDINLPDHTEHKSVSEIISTSRDESNCAHHESPLSYPRNKRRAMTIS